MNKISEKLDSIFEILSKENPDPKIELNYINDFTLLVAIMLSAQTTDISVNKVTDKLFQIIQTPNDAVKLGLDNLMQHLSSLNLYKTKSKHVIETAKILIEKFHSKVPNDFEELIKLPGVGRKTANVFLGTFYNHHDRIGVDTHVTRVSNRLGICKTQNVVTIEKTLMENISPRWGNKAHHWLVLHGRYICKAKKPKCDICSIKNFCDYYEEVNKSILIN
jgi:endonuclease-3